MIQYTTLYFIFLELERELLPCTGCFFPQGTRIGLHAYIYIYVLLVILSQVLKICFEVRARLFCDDILHEFSLQGTHAVDGGKGNILVLGHASVEASMLRKRRPAQLSPIVVCYERV